MLRLPARRALPLIAIAVVGAGTAAVADANHISSSPCASKGACAGHEFWPKMTLSDVRKTSMYGGGTLVGFPGNSDELLGWHGNDTLLGGDKADVLWADHVGENQPRTQVDKLYGGAGDDFLYSAAGRNTIEGGPGNDAIKARYGKGVVDCGPGRDIVHVPNRRKRNWRFIGCEKFESRSESELGRGLKPLPGRPAGKVKGKKAAKG